MKKLFTVCLLCLLFTLPVSSQNDLLSAVSNAEEKIDRQIEPVNSRFSGKWIFKDNNCTTTIEILSGGDMQIVHASGNTKTFYRGTYSSVSDKILFHVQVVEIKRTFSKTTSHQDMYWQLNAVFTDKKHLKVLSKDIPEALNGQAFQMGVVFEKD